MAEMAHAIARHVHATNARRQVALEWRVECTILPHLVVIAALEHLNHYMPGFVPPTPPPHNKDDANDYNDNDVNDNDEGCRKRQGKIRLTPPLRKRYLARLEDEVNFPPLKIAKHVGVA